MLDEQPGQERIREAEHAASNAQPGLERTLPANWIAFGSGLLLAFLTANALLSLLGPDLFSDTSFPGWSVWLYFPIPFPFFLLLPLALGIAVPFPVGRQRRHLISSALGRS